MVPKTGSRHMVARGGSGHTGMLPLTNGDLLIYGYTEPESGSEHDQYALLIASGGGAIWEYVGDSRLDELVIDALETPAGDLVLAVAIVGQDGELVKLDAGGRVL